MEKTPLIHRETQERTARFQTLSDLEGFNKFSHKQQQMIRLSLYIQQRAVRGTDKGSQENLGISDETGDIFVNFPRETDELNLPIENKYRLSQKHIYDWYCHATVTGLEKEVMDRKVFDETDVPKLLNKTGYEIKSEADIADFIAVALEEVEVPAVLHVLAHGIPYHSAILLGTDETGEHILWEKKGFSIPYQLTTLKEIYHTYASHNQEWLIRPINTAPLRNEG